MMLPVYVTIVSLITIGLIGSRFLSPGIHKK